MMVNKSKYILIIFFFFSLVFSFNLIALANFETAIRKSNVSGTVDDARVSVSCLRNEVLIGCECNSPWNSCDGAFFSGNTCIAQNKNHGEGVFAVAVCAAANDEILNSRSIWGNRSPRHDDAESIASCPPEAPYLTGCTCFSNWGNCDGEKARMDSNSCIAYNANGGPGVWASARCINVRPTPSVTYREGPPSARWDDAPSVAACPDGYTLTDCGCHSFWNSCDGAEAEADGHGENTCTAYNRNGGSGVFAEAICMRLEDESQTCAESCGGRAPTGCYCDEDCSIYGDCCDDYQRVCQ